MLTAFKRLHRGRNKAFLSAFGGLWIDKIDSDRELARRIALKKLPEDLAEKITGFIADGYVVLPGAVDPALCERIVAIVDRAYALGDERLRYHTDGAENHVPAANTDPHGKRIVESHAVLAEVRAALSSPRIVAFLRAIFDEPVVLTQTLIFQTGSEQDFHQDPVFVNYDEPLKMAAAWIALEDVAEGSGELQYIPKSHRLSDYVFSNGRRDSHGAQSGELSKFGAWLSQESERRGLVPQRFLAKKGDVLIWHAGLAHGGSPVTKPGLTRRSLVGHFCPASVRPRYAHANVRQRDGDLLYSSYIRP